jgi:uncharacterized protein YndB with AHSA1/START domain/ketosteroid isomerase-like protein
MTATAKRATPKPVATREITVSRTFAAPRALVFSMFTDPKHLAAWWGPHGFTNPVCEADAREGGRILIHMRAPDGNVHPMGGIFHEIKPHDRIVFTSFVDMPDGKRVLEGLNTVTFEEQRGRTRVTVHARAEGYVDFATQMLAGMEAGWSQSLDKLASHGLRAAGAQDADDQEKIRAIFGDRTNALFCKSVDLAVKHFAEDLVSYDLAPPLEHVGPGRQGLQDWFDTWDGPIAFAMGDLTLEVGGDIALARGLGHMTGTKKDGAKVDLWARVTVGLNRRDGTWKITHQHTSVPFLMDGSFKAAVDLKP